MRKTILLGAMAFLAVIAVLIVTEIVAVGYGLVIAATTVVSMAVVHRIFCNEEA